MLTANVLQLNADAVSRCKIILFERGMLVNTNEQNEYRTKIK